MKILFVCENYIPHYGGAEVVFKNLAERYIAQGHEVSLVTHQLRGTKRREILNGVKIYRVPSAHSRYLFSFAAIPLVTKLAKKHDVIQTTTFNGAPPAWIAGAIARKPVILTVHEVWINKWGNVTSFPFWKQKIHDFLERAMYTLPFDSYICVSSATRKDLLTSVRKARRRSTVIYNGMDYDFWDVSKCDKNSVTKSRNVLGTPKQFVFFAWGRPGESKGFEYLIEAFGKVQETIPYAKLVLMLGSKEKYRKKYADLRKLVSRYSRNGSITIIPSAPYDQLREFVLAADCVVVPSIAEGFGYNAVEATSVGKPLIASSAGSLPEVVSGKHLLFQSKNCADLGDKMIQAVTGKFKESPIKRFEWDGSVNQYLTLYRDAIARRAR